MASQKISLVCARCYCATKKAVLRLKQNKKIHKQTAPWKFLNTSSGGFEKTVQRSLPGQLSYFRWLHAWFAQSAIAPHIGNNGPYWQQYLFVFFLCYNRILLQEQDVLVYVLNIISFFALVLGKIPVTQVSKSNASRLSKRLDPCHGVYGSGSRRRKKRERIRYVVLCVSVRDPERWVHSSGYLVVTFPGVFPRGIVEYAFPEFPAVSRTSACSIRASGSTFMV